MYMYENSLHKTVQLITKGGSAASVKRLEKVVITQILAK